MIIRLANRTMRLVLVIVALIFAVSLSYLGTRNALAGYYSRLGTIEGYEHATRLEPSNAQYWDLLGRSWQLNTERYDAQSALHAYQMSLSLDLRSADTWLDLAALQDEENNPDAAREAYIQAKNANSASPEASWRYGNFLLRRGEVNQAVSEIRRALKIDPKRSIAAFLIFRHIEPDLDIVWERDLPSIPSVYLDVIQFLTNEGHADQALKVWARLLALHIALPQKDILYFVEGLMNKNQTMEARQVWNQAIRSMNLPKTNDPDDSLVWDGGFETDVTGEGLAWRIGTTTGAFIDYDNDVKHSGRRSLRIRFDGTQNLFFEGVCQRVAVEPNTKYEFSAWLKTKDLTTDQGLFFRLITPEIPGSQSATTAKITGTKPWTKVSLDWEAPSGVHALRLCVVRNPTSNSEDYRIAGTAWADDIYLRPLTPKPINR